MAHPKFEELPFNQRPDLTPYIIHLTKTSEKFSAFENLLQILRDGKIKASPPARKGGKGFIKGPRSATCFMDVPFLALKYVLSPDNTSPENPRYEPFGIVVRKEWSYKKRACRPVLYLSDAEVENLELSSDQLWRVVRFESTTNKRWIGWLHEREWRCEGDFRLSQHFTAVLVKSTADAFELSEILHGPQGKKYKARPMSIIPLEVICQGFLK